MHEKLPVEKLPVYEVEELSLEEALLFAFAPEWKSMMEEWAKEHEAPVERVRPAAR